MSKLILHNGNKLVKDWAAQQLPDCVQLPCVVDPWIINGIRYCTIDEKLTALVPGVHYCTDLTVADSISYTDLAKLKSKFEFVKIVSSYEFDIDHLEPQWTQETYTQQQWLRCLISNLAFSDKLIFWDPVRLEAGNNPNRAMFDPGHCGNHVLMSILGMNPGDHKQLIHHDHDLIGRPMFSFLLNTGNIFSIVRKNILGQVLSDLVTDVYGPLVTTLENLEQHKQIVAQWKPIECRQQDFDASLAKVAGFADIALGLRYFYNKDIKLFFMERMLAEHSSKIKYLKNPYHYPEIISNYTEIVEKYNQQYQSVYNIVVSKLESVFGETIIKNV